MTQGKFAWCVCWVGLAAGLSGVGCSSPSGHQGGAKGPTITIASPVTGATVSPASEPHFPDVSVILAVDNFTFKNPHRSDGSSCPPGTCGHARLLVDDGNGDFTKCNDKNVPYNSLAVSLTDSTVGLDYCLRIDGIHDIVAELVNDDESPVRGSDGGLTTSRAVSITAVGGGDGGLNGADAKP